MEYVKNLNVVILAAGKGKRMMSSTPKVLHNIIDKPMIYYVLKEAGKLNPENIYVITGHEHDILKGYLADNFPDVIPVFQEHQLGTGHAVSLLKEYVNENWESVLVLTGDCPLIKSETLKKLVASRQAGNYAGLLVTALLENPFGYGRIIKNQLGEIIRIVEEADATLKEKLIREINPSVYCFDVRALFDNISSLDSNNYQKEYYLTGIIEKFTYKNLKTSTLMIDDSSEVLGINDRIQLSVVEKLMRKRINEKFMS
ncbi:MAG: NTP transferase domain-containing protein, partial [Actinobacteria bacterium]|nr:NTP transferase domain-containing protein [Actinomycetota bacterium]